MRNTVEGISNRITEAEEQINGIEIQSAGNHHHRTK